MAKTNNLNEAAFNLLHEDRENVNIHTGIHVSFSPIKPVSRAFTLIEVLVVVAIIALLVSILLPSLARAREQARVSIDCANQKEIGKAVFMYLTESKDIFPGPVHPVMLKERLNYTVAQQDFALTNKLRKYFSEKSTNRNSNSISDKISVCPSFPVADKDMVTPNGSRVDPFNYALQSGTWTKDQYWFGFTHGGIKDIQEWQNVYGNDNKYRPKNVIVVKQPSREWLMACAFERPFRNGDYPSQYPGLPRGSWALENNDSLNSGYSLPKSPFHYTTGCERRSPASIFKGKATTLFADWHVECAFWKGTVLENRHSSY